MLNEVWEFLKNPIYLEDDNEDFKHRVRILFKILGLSIAFSILLGLLIGVFQTIFEIDFGEHAIDKVLEKYPISYLFFAAVVLAPIIEETIFRGPLYFFRNSAYFKWVFYLLTIIFGFYHVTHFEITKTVLFFSPLLVAPQLIAGTFFGFIRVRFGLLWSIALHTFYNLILVGPVVLFKILDIPLE